MRYITHKVDSIYFANLYREMRLNFYKEKPLWLIHETTSEDYSEEFKVGMDSITEFHKKFYDKYREGWGEMESWYNDIFIKWVIAPLIDEDFLYQKFPNIRFHLPNNVAVGKTHKDSDFGHPKFEINFIIPLTESDDTASIWVESEPDKGDFEPMIMRVGELIQFNGNELTHGNKLNLTGKTRVSLDFRVLPISKYNPNNTNTSLTKKTKFIEGEYYKLFKK